MIESGLFIFVLIPILVALWAWVFSIDHADELPDLREVEWEDDIPFEWPEQRRRL